MGDNPLRSVYSYVERAYMRMQAGDVLSRCLEEGTTAPIQQMVEGLVLAGPHSLGALREAMEETGQRKALLQEDLHQLIRDLALSLRSYGVSLDDRGNVEAITGLSQVGFLALLREQEIHDNKTQMACLQILKDSRELIESLSAHYLLLQEIEGYLKDWILALVVQSLRQEPKAQSLMIDPLQH